MHVICVVVAAVIEQAAPSIVTAALVVKPVPRIFTTVPPVCGPNGGTTLVMFGVEK